MYKTLEKLKKTKNRKNWIFEKWSKITNPMNIAEREFQIDADWLVYSKS